jgi:hypothetical protein
MKILSIVQYIAESDVVPLWCSCYPLLYPLSVAFSIIFNVVTHEKRRGYFAGMTCFEGKDFFITVFTVFYIHPTPQFIIRLGS